MNRTATTTAVTLGWLSRGDETSWQVFEVIAGKDGHRWWLWVFVTDATTVLVMDTSRSADVAVGQLGIDREQSALEAGRRLVTSSDFHPFGEPGRKIPKF